MKIAKFAFSLFGINTYAVYDPGTLKCAIIDPGMINAGEQEALAGFVKRNNLTVTHIINTHLHVDHAIGNRYAAELFKAPVLAHPDDLFLGKRLNHQAVAFGIEQDVDNVSVTTELRDGDIIRIGDGELNVIHVPGHSPGSVALYDRQEGFVVVGDAMFSGSIGRTDLPGGDYDLLISSIKKKLLTLPSETVVYPGHGPATTIGSEAESNPFLRQ